MLEGCTPWPEEFARRYLREGYWRKQTLADLLKQAALFSPSRVLVSDGDRRLTYEQVNRLADRLALHLLDRGFRPRDIVLLQFPNIWEFVVVFFALHKIGVIPIMCLPMHRQSELTYLPKPPEPEGTFLPLDFATLTMPRWRGRYRRKRPN